MSIARYLGYRELMGGREDGVGNRGVGGDEVKGKIEKE